MLDKGRRRDQDEEKAQVYMKKPKRKYYLIVDLTETDGECCIRRLSGDEVRSLPKADRIHCAVIEGNVIKDFSNTNFDFTNL